jgi:flagellar basal body-associated protein FliL
MSDGADESRFGILIVLAAVLACAVVAWMAWPSGPSPDTADRSVPPRHDEPQQEFAS